MKKYYKVVTKKLESARASIWSKSADFSTQYLLNEFVYPRAKGTKLFVFDNLKYAKRFKLSYELVFECEVVNPKKSSYYSGEIGNVINFWKKYRTKQKISTFEKSLEGTVFCDAVKLTKQIQ